MANRSRPKQIVIRASAPELERIQRKVSESKLTQNEYLLRAALDKEITVMDGIRELTIEIKRIGNNLNQLTREVHEGRANCAIPLLEIKKELGEVWQSLRRLIQGRA